MVAVGQGKQKGSKESDRKRKNKSYELKTYQKISCAKLLTYVMYTYFKRKYKRV